MLQIIDRNRDVFDAVVVGSGATGAFAAKQLTEAGMRVAVLEAGKKITPADFTEHVEPYQLKYRGNSSNILNKPKSPNIMRYRPIQGRLYACVESNYPWFVNDYENPYTTPPGKPFHWIRMRVLGGRSLSWGRQSYRLSDLDFKAASHDGFGDDWPISHDELAPYYETVERFIGISGQAEGLAQLPDSVFLPPMEMTCGEKIFRNAAVKKMGRAVTIGRAAVLTRPLNGRGNWGQFPISVAACSSPAETLDTPAILKRRWEPSDWHHTKETRKKPNKPNFTQPTCNQLVTAIPSCSAVPSSAEASLPKSLTVDGSPFDVDSSRLTVHGLPKTKKGINKISDNPL